MTREGARRLAFLFFIASLTWALWSGFRASEVRDLDGRALYVAGRCWLERVSPYDAAEFARVWEHSLGERHRAAFVFAYPPTAVVLAAPLALLPWPAARYLLAVANLLALAASLAACATLLRRWLGVTPRDPRLWAGLGAACLVGAVAGTLQLGQTGLLALAGALVGFLVADRGSPWLFAGAVMLATVKPQVTAFALLAILVAAGVSRFAAAVALSGIVAVVGLAAAGVLLHPGQLVEALASYREVGANTGQQLAGLTALTSSLSVDLNAGWLAAAGLVAFAALLWVGLREPFGRGGVSACALACLSFSASVTFLPSHGYDYVAFLLPLAAWPSFPMPWTLVLAPALIAAARPNPLAAAIHEAVPPSALGGAGALLASLVFALLVWRRGKRSTPSA